MDHNSNYKPWSLDQASVARLDQVVAITTPIPNNRGCTSSKTPIFQLPVYEIKLKSEQHDSGTIKFHCDLADLTDLIDKLKSYQSLCLKLGQQSS